MFALLINERALIVINSSSNSRALTRFQGVITRIISDYGTLVMSSADRIRCKVVVSEHTSLLSLAVEDA